MEGYKFLWVLSKSNRKKLHKIKGCPQPSLFLALVKLEIPDDATVIHPIDRWEFMKLNDIHPILKIPQPPLSIKCRCSKAKIVDVIDYYKYTDVYYDLIKKMTKVPANPKDLIFFSMWKPSFQYEFDKYVEPDKLDEDPMLECSNGIHFCRTIEDTFNYMDGYSSYTIDDFDDISIDFTRLDKYKQSLLYKE